MKRHLAKFLVPNRTGLTVGHTVGDVDETSDLELYIDTVTTENQSEESAYADIQVRPQKKLTF